MKSRRLGCGYAIALTGMLSLSAPSAQTEKVLCGLSHETEALAKASELPRTAKAWSGKLKVLIFRISFADAPYSIDTTSLQNTDAAINALYASMSRNAFAWDFKIYPAILRAPESKAVYDLSFNSLQSWIASQVSATGLRRGIDYDVYIANFPQLNLEWSGLSNLKDADWINGSYGAGVTAHELGHSLGLPHAHSVEAGTDMFGTPGTASQTNEYGFPYDVMGHGGSTGHFNVLYKLRVGWEDTNEVKEIRASGVYRIYAQDNAMHKSRLIGIRVPSGNPGFAYWFEYRTQIPNARLGASVIFQGFKSATNLDAWYLDATPGSRFSGDENDGVLAVGKQFQDKYGEATFRTLAINTNVWNEEGWVDLQVTIPGSAPATFPPSGNFLQAMRADGSQAFNMLGQALGHALPAQVLVLKSDAGKLQVIQGPALLAPLGK